MKIRQHIFLLAALFTILSCAKRHSQTSWNSENPEKNSKEQYPEAEVGPYQKGSDPVTIKSISLKGNILTLEVSYSGGCVDPHEFRLIGSNALAKSLPPIRNVQLFHDAKGDNCKALKTEKLQFSIVRLAEHHDKGNKVKLQFENYNKEMLEYSYE